MTTDSDHPLIIPLTEEVNYAVTWKSAAGLGFSKYEVSANGFGRDQRPVRNRITGKLMVTKPGNSTGGYLQVKIYHDDGRQRTVNIHSLVLGVYSGPRPEGMETRHLDNDPLNNRWRPGNEAETRSAGGNLIWGTKGQNIADQIAAGTLNGNTPYPCINHERCGGRTVNPGRRCLPCAMEVGNQAAAMLYAGLHRDEVTRRLGYKNPAWVEKLARDYGGFSGPLPRVPQRRPRRQPLPQRVMATLRYRMKIRRRSP